MEFWETPENASHPHRILAPEKHNAYQTAYQGVLSRVFSDPLFGRNLRRVLRLRQLHAGVAQR